MKRDDAIAAPTDMPLMMKSSCERCTAALPMDAAGARICSHECTFCADCAQALQNRCPNCGGELVARPRRLPLGGASEILNT